jgi:hypothetical protein
MDELMSSEIYGKNRIHALDIVEDREEGRDAHQSQGSG